MPSASGQAILVKSYRPYLVLLRGIGNMQNYIYAALEFNRNFGNLDYGRLDFDSEYDGCDL